MELQMYLQQQTCSKNMSLSTQCMSRSFLNSSRIKSIVLHCCVELRAAELKSRPFKTPFSFFSLRLEITKQEFRRHSRGKREHISPRKNKVTPFNPTSTSYSRKYCTGNPTPETVCMLQHL